ncbi:uncharacterized protein LOC128670256 [Plodia interpunctella]|uniref:uncharacterized protein LOC128670256 n=1 Tax=Plodia interpunctella TaxID=58824 RepID=UPI00236752B9|nr:uncharacterized protein LOC128670256 [Plodia interpunctella]
MIKFILLGLVFTTAVRADQDVSKRQKKFLFYDEGGRMVNIFSNPYLQNFFLNAGNLPLFWNFLNPFFNYLRPISISGTSACFMIPVSEQVVQDIANDPVYENSLVLPQKQPVIEPNPLCAGKRGSFSSPKSCSAFLNCWDGWAFEQQCPEGLMFSGAGYCDYSDNVDCKNRFKPVPSPPAICKQDFQTFRNKENCNEFFVCVGRQPVKFQCPADLAYNETLGICDYRDQVNCAPALPDAPSSPQAGAAPPVPAFPPPLAPAPSDPAPSPPLNRPAPINFYPTAAPATAPPASPLFPSLAPKPYYGSDFIFSNSIIKQESLLAGHRAASREDAIKQLLSSIAIK